MKIIMTMCMVVGITMTVDIVLAMAIVVTTIEVDNITKIIIINLLVDIRTTE